MPSMSTPLGYVFWHRPLHGVSRAGYEASLLRFQSSLRENPPAGFLDALAFRVDTLPWSRSHSSAYEDWYLVRDFKALGDLNAGAVGPANKSPHDEAARKASAIAGGLYKLIDGKLPACETRVATWMSKPASKSYEDFLADLRSLESLTQRIWQRQMVLGPAPEFCVHSRRASGAPHGARGRVVKVTALGESLD